MEAGLRSSPCLFQNVLRRSRGGWQEVFLLVEEAVRLKRLAMHFIEGRDIVVPFQKRSRGAAPFDGAFVELPDGFDDRVVWRVESVFLKLGVTVDVNLGDPFGWNAVHILQRVESVIARRDVDVIYVEKNAAVGLFDHFVQELPLGHLGEMEFCIAADVLDGYRYFDKVLDLPHLFAGYSPPPQTLPPGPPVL